MKKLLLMKNNFCFIKNPQRHLIAFLVLFCGLFANTISAQTTYTWIGPSGGNWGSAANWLPSGVPGGNVLDQAIIDNGGNVTLASGTVTITKLTISNNTGPLEGSTLTINAGATLNVDGVSGVNPIVISGGNLVNNGTLVAKSGSNSGTVGMFLFGNPAVAPTSGSYTYGYTGGTGSTLDISYRSSGTGGQNSTQFLINGTNTFSKYKLVFNGNINFAMEAKNSFAIRTVADTSPISISGSGFNTANGLMLMAARTNVTVETGTTLTSNVVANTQQNTIMQNNSKLINKGTINILGGTTAHGIQITGASGTDTLLDNQGTLNVDIASSTASRAPLGVQGGSGGTLTINNSGTMTLKNTNPNTGANVGCAYLAFSSPANVNFTNNNILNLSGTNVTAGGGTTTLTNNGTIAANNAFQGLAVINNSGKTIAFVKDAATIASTNALTVGAIFSTNNGILQTAAGATELNNLALVTTLSSTSSIEPGGATGKGIASFSAASVSILGTLKLQVAGNSAAGIDYDQVNNVFTDGGFDVTGATLDVTGMSAAPSPVDIILANGAGKITGTFASVIGLASGWSVNYGVAGKVQLAPSLKVNESEFNTNSVSVYKNNGSLYVNSRTVAIRNIKVYDLMGRMIIDQKDVKSNTASINNLKAINQVLIVKISGEDNTQVIKKVMF